MIVRASTFAPEEAARAVGGRLDPGHGGAAGLWTGISTDTRDPLEGRLFVALAGERFDAHDFLGRAVEGGAAGLLVSESAYQRVGARKAVGTAVDVVVAEDSLRGLGELARYHRSRMGTPVVAITGSNGKTSTKEMLAAILAVETSVLATEGNLNNLVGLPLTLLGLESHHRVCVLEMGMNALGEIARMVEIADPQVGVVTNVGPAHIGALGSIENIARAKGEMYAGLAGGATGVVNADDHRVVAQADASGVGPRRSFGRAIEADVRLVDLEARGVAQRVKMSVDGVPIEAELPVPGAHNAMNAAAAVAAATALGEASAGTGALVSGLAALRGAPGRMAVRNVGTLTVIDDSYNANAASSVAAVEAAVELAGARRLVAAFGEMKELGGYSSAAHRDVGEALARAGVRVVAAFGPDAAPLAEAARGAVRHEASDFEALAAWFLSRIEDGDVVLIKGSRTSRMERLVARLEEPG